MDRKATPIYTLNAKFTVYLKFEKTSSAYKNYFIILYGP